MCDNDTNTSAPEHGWIRCERGQALVEYALILMFVSITAIALTPVGGAVAAKLGQVAGAL
jgi:Flp pilus assembly pilin Flp